MFHPVSSQPPSVYWRRRALLVVALLMMLLVLLTVRAFGSGGASTAAATRSPGRAGGTSGATGATGAVSTTTTAGGPSGARRPSATARSRARGHRRVASARTSPFAPPTPCNVGALSLTAAVDKPTYPVGAHPLVQLQVINTGGRPCVQDLADRPVELRIYNGASRVWGSHDCKIAPGSSERILAPSVPVRVAIPWSGLTSQPGCRGVRQRVGPGTYTVYAALAGRTGRAVQFSIS